MSDFMLTIPCIFNRWFAVPIVDMLRELQLMDDTVRFLKLLPKLVIVQSTLVAIKTIRLRVAGASLPIVTEMCTEPEPDGVKTTLPLTSPSSRGSPWKFYRPVGGSA